MENKASNKKPVSKGLNSQLNFEEGSYLETTARPLYALLFLVPLIALYEMGTFWFLTDDYGRIQLRIAAFSWLMSGAEWIGVSRNLAWAFPGLLVVLILFCWQMSSQFNWAVQFPRLFWMWLESIVLTIPLFVFGALINSSRSFAAPNGIQSDSYLANIITSVGAGIYEELVFRLILMGLLLLLFEDLAGMKKVPALILSGAISGLLFAAHHYAGWIDGSLVWLEKLESSSFIFRALAGFYFAFLFHYRGFGIVAGTHAAYDVIHYTMTNFLDV